MKFQVAKLGKSSTEHTLNQDMVTVESALKIADAKVGSKDQVLLNGEQVKNLSTRISDGAVIAVIPKVKGGHN